MRSCWLDCGSQVVAQMQWGAQGSQLHQIAEFSVCYIRKKPLFGEGTIAFLVYIYIRSISTSDACIYVYMSMYIYIYIYIRSNITICCITYCKTRMHFWHGLRQRHREKMQQLVEEIVHFSAMVIRWMRYRNG